MSSIEPLVERARSLAADARGGRALLGIVGAPGAGKSTLASVLAARLGPADAVVVPMDGFHLAHAELTRLGRVERKGAPDTFDCDGFVAVLRRLRASEDNVVYVPEFRRSIEDAVAGAIPVPREVPLVIVEGNYLLLDAPPWDEVRGLLTEAWYLEVDEDTRLKRLVARHIEFGRTPEAARAHALVSDQRNAERIAASAHRAHLRVELSPTVEP